MTSGCYNSSLSENDLAAEQNSVISVNVLKLIGASLSEPHTSMTALRTRLYLYVMLVG